MQPRQIYSFLWKRSVTSYFVSQGKSDGRKLRNSLVSKLHQRQTDDLSPLRPAAVTVDSRAVDKRQAPPFNVKQSVQSGTIVHSWTLSVEGRVAFLVFLYIDHHPSPYEINHGKSKPVCKG